MRQRKWIPRSYLVVLFGLACRAVLQAALTVVAARVLGRLDFGASVAIAGVAGFFATWAGLGAPALHLRDCALEPDRWRSSFARMHRRIALSLLPLIAVAVLAAWLAINGRISPLTLVLLVSGELLGAPTADLIARSYQGRSRYSAMAAAVCALPSLRLTMLGGAVLLTQGPVTLTHWAYVVFASGLILAACGFVLSLRSRRRKKDDGAASAKHASGVAFAAAAAASRVHADVDKVILARMSSMGIAGEYSLAYRIVDVLLLPIVSLIEWSTRAMFEHGQSGAVHAVRVLWARWLGVVALSLLACVVMLGVAPFLPWIFGPQFEGVKEIARWLCLLPLTSACWITVRSIAATTGRERQAAAVESGGAILSVALCIALVALIDWRGAVIATCATHIAMTMVMLIVIRRTSVGSARAEVAGADHEPQPWRPQT